jgi:hypothetical protein
MSPARTRGAFGGSLSGTGTAVHAASPLAIAGDTVSHNLICAYVLMAPIGRPLGQSGHSHSTGKRIPYTSGVGVVPAFPPGRDGVLFCLLGGGRIGAPSL